MKKTGAWLAVYALEQLGIRWTFGIPGVHNIELYDELNKSEQITPVLVTHEGGAAFMADAVSRVSDGSIGVLAIVPAAGLTHAASGIGEALLDGIPMLVITGGVRTDLNKRYQLHEIDQLEIARGLTKAAFRVERHAEVAQHRQPECQGQIRHHGGAVVALGVGRMVKDPLEVDVYPAVINELPVLAKSVVLQVVRESRSNSGENLDIAACIVKPAQPGPRKNLQEGIGYRSGGKRNNRRRQTFYGRF